jgi:long-chain acyl-CoA synthetase
LGGYGQTEGFACGLISAPTAKHLQPYGPNVGSPYSCCELKLIDALELGYSVNDQPYPRGQLCMRGNNVFIGYLKDEEKTKETFQGDWLLTGDICEFLPDGTVRIIDRSKNTFKLSQGEFVSVERIENMLASNALVSQCFVDLKMDQSFLVAVVVPDETRVKQYAAENGIKGTFEELCRNKVIRDWVLKSVQKGAKAVDLNSYEIPKEIVLEHEPFTPENLLITPTFKNKRRELKKKYGAVVDEMYRTALARSA